MKLPTLKPRVQVAGNTLPTMQPGSWRTDKQTTDGRGYTYRWKLARAQFLKEHPLCVYCLKADRLIVATVVDHKEPHRGNKELFWNRMNWQALCKLCHDSTKAKEEAKLSETRLAR